MQAAVRKHVEEPSQGGCVMVSWLWLPVAFLAGMAFVVGAGIVFSWLMAGKYD